MARRIAFEALTLVEEQGMRAGEALDAVLDRIAAHRGGPDQVDVRDEHLAWDIVQGVLRTEIQLDAIIAMRIPRLMSEQDPDVLRILRIGAYQILHQDRVPPWAAVSSAVELANAVRRERASGFVNAVLRRITELALEVSPEEGPDPRRSLPRPDGTWRLLNDAILPDPADGLAMHLACRWGMPAWIVDRFLRQHGEAGTTQILAASIARPSLSLRPRAGRTEAVEAALTGAGIAFEREGPCILLRSAGSVPNLPGFGEGDFAVQDPTSAEVVPFLAPQPGERILDTCAAPGGKTFAISEIVGEGGAVIALDLPGRRLTKLERERDRRGITNVEVIGADATQATTLPGTPYDAVLVDAPCSNTGVLARRVEARRRLTGPAPLQALLEIQARLLAAGARHVRPGGRLVWSTCSVDTDENAAQVRAFLASDAGTGFTLAAERQTLPLARRHDGGYVAMLRRV